MQKKCSNCGRPLKPWNNTWRSTVYMNRKVETQLKNVCICGHVTVIDEKEGE